MSASAQPTRASSRNHNHTRTPLQGRAPPPSRLQSAPAHTPHPNQNTAQRLDMHSPPTPPDGESKRGLTGGSEPPTTPNASPRPGKFGASPSAPSFAAVVSSSGAPRTAARSPLSTTPTSSLQHTQQIHEHAHPSAAPFSLELVSGTDDDGLNIIGDTAAASVAPSTAPLSSSPSYPSSLGGSLMPRGSDNTTPIIHSDNNNTNSTAIDADSADQEQENDPEDSESSDVEIYLNTLGLHDSAARMHVFVGPGATGSNTSTAPTLCSSNSLTMQPSNESPILPSTAQFSGGSATHQSNPLTLRVSAANLNSTKSLSALSFAPPASSTSPPTSLQHSLHLPRNSSTANPIAQATSPQLPPAPTHGTIPLPQFDDSAYIQDADARQLQSLQQHQQMHAQQSAACDTGTIDRAGLAGGGGGLSEGPRGQQQQQHQLGLPSAHSQPMLTVDPPFECDSRLGSASNFPTSVSESGLSGAGQKTPNVYINGLPPHFREDQLFDLACPFGAIRSVRTFTRHVRDSESGYGFVLFETIEAAEKCIISLRRYRNLHPTFSKQIHKIPGTTYAQGAVAPSSSTSTWNEPSLDSESGSIGGSNEGSLGAEASFKAKMESLQDPTSTNLYMEGLPLSIDEPTLAALVAPHVISSSRFFHTRLSNPPRIIAFVRLETRKGAEEIIERLHGRMVRGWNDTGSRISVRFADTSEQRELRRTERSAQEGDTSPARLTIAQAALLNLRGKELGPEQTGPVVHARGPGAGRLPSVSARGGFSTSASAPDFASNAHLFPLANELSVDYSLAPGRTTLVNPASRSRSPYQTQQDLGYLQSDPYSQAQVGFNQTSSASMDPAMASLLTSLSNTNLSYQGASGGYESAGSADLDYMQDQRTGHIPQYPQVGHHHLATSQSLTDIHQYGRPAPAYTRSGYTPTEEYIMRAHAESAALAHAHAQQQQAERRRPAPLDLRRRRGEEGAEDAAPANIAVGMRGYRVQASIGRLGQGLMSPSTSMASPPMGMGMNLMAEDDFHPSAMGGRNDFGQQFSNGNGDVNRAVGSASHTRHNPNIHPAHVNARLSRDPPPSAPSNLSNYSHMQHSPLTVSPSLPSAPASSQESPNPNQAIHYQHAAAHLRATTLPQHRTSSARDGQQQQLAAARGHYQHSSLSMPAQNLRTPQHASVAAFGGAGGVEGDAGTIYEDSSREEQQQQQQQRSDAGLGAVGAPSGSNVVGSNAPQLAAKSHYSPSSQHIFGEMESSSSTSSLISPTLTYGTQTPSTLSPATPFFGSFSSQTEGFEKGAHGSGAEGQQKKQVNSGSGVGLSSLRS